LETNKLIEAPRRRMTPAELAADFSPAAKNSCFEIRSLTFKYPTRERPALDDVNLTIERGEFVTLCGPSGCGKTTLLRHLKPSTTPHGFYQLTVSGEQLTVDEPMILFESKLLSELSPHDAAARIGFVMQSPENQIVTDKVWHELAFGLESLGVETPEIRLRVAEMASFFGIQTWFHKPVAELSGGQKQLLALASIMVLQPSALILDEPTSQLDPIAAGEFLATVGKINHELGVTVVLTEHRLEEVFPLSTRAVVMDSGRVVADGPPREVGLTLRERGSGMFLAMPTPMRVWGQLSTGKDGALLGSKELSQSAGGCECPITVRDGSDWLRRLLVGSEQLAVGGEQLAVFEPDERFAGLGCAITIRDVWFKYEKNLPDVVKGLSLTANYGEVTAILGGNGTGKTTTLGLIDGINVPYRGKVVRHGYTCKAGEDPQTPNSELVIHNSPKVYSLPQDPQALFVAKTVREDLLEILSGRKLSKGEKKRRLAAMVKLCRLGELLDSHPYDLSGGEQQRAALAKVLLLQPKILLLDEPTKGLDAEFKQIFAAILRRLAEGGAAIILVSHDIEFCAEYADRCALFFDGNIVTENTPRKFFSGNSFYTTSANRMAREFLPDAITANDVITALGGEAPPAPQILDVDAKYEIDVPELPPPPAVLKLPERRKVIFAAFALWLLVAMVFAAVNREYLGAFIGGGHDAIAVAAEGAAFYMGNMIGIAIGILGIAATLSWKRGEKPPPATLRKQKLTKRTITAAAMILLTIPLTIFIGIHVFGDRRFYFIALLVILQTMLPFAFVFESRKPLVRELVIIAVLCAITVAGRSVFFMLPQFKPVIALVIIAGVAFGGEAGFLVGAMSFLVSNMFFGQGPWTPWQMFSAGIIGFLAGVLFRKGMLRRSPTSLAVFGGIATFAIYGGIMSPASVLMWQPNPTRTMILMSYLHGLSFNLVHAAATVAFMVMISKTMLEKLDRIKVKYGLVE